MNWSDDNHSRWKEDELRRAAKIDGPQPAIVDALRAMGVFVQSLAQVGEGCPDLLCACPGELWLFEVKEIGGRLTPKQKDWHDKVRQRNHIVYDVASAIGIAKHYLGKAKA